MITAGNFGQWNGLQQTIAPQNPWAPDVRYGSLADIADALPNVRFIPESRHDRVSSACRLSAINEHLVSYSITSSASRCKFGGNFEAERFRSF